MNLSLEATLTSIHPSPAAVAKRKERREEKRKSEGKEDDDVGEEGEDDSICETSSPQSQRLAQSASEHATANAANGGQWPESAFHFCSAAAELAIRAAAAGGKLTSLHGSKGAIKRNMAV